MSKLMLLHMQTVSKLFKYWSTSSELESASSISKLRKFYQFQTFFRNGLQQYSMIFTFGATHYFSSIKNFQKLMFKRKDLMIKRLKKIKDFFLY